MNYIYIITLHNHTTSIVHIDRFKLRILLVMSKDRVSNIEVPYVPVNVYDNTQRNQQEGELHELQFRNLCLSKGWTFQLASRDQNINDHIDCFITTPSGCSSVDVKAPKRISRKNHNGSWCQVQDEYMWCEWTTVNGSPGWARSNVEWVAFGLLNGSFLMVYRPELSYYLKKMIDLWHSKGARKAKHPRNAVNGCLWTRYGRQDEVTLIHKAFLMGLYNTKVLSW